MRGRQHVSRLVFVIALALFLGCSSGDATSESESAVVAGVAQRIDYGDHDDAFGDLWLPAADDGSPRPAAPVVVLIHGGFWRDEYALDEMDPLIPSLLDNGFAVWNIEYRRVGAGGGYPETFIDAADAIDALADLPATDEGLLDLGEVSTVGHSAGGHLAVWLASRRLLPPGAPGVDPVVLPQRAVAQAGVLDLIGCVDQRLGGMACLDLVGATLTDDAERYAQTSPAEMVPIEADVIAVHGSRDGIVPVSQSETYVERALSTGGNARIQIVEGADHFDHLDPLDPAWIAVLDALAP